MNSSTPTTNLPEDELRYSPLFAPRPPQSRRIIPAREYSAVDVPLDDILVDGRLDLYQEVSGKDYFHIYLKENQLVFTARGYVGLIPINDRVAIDVRPRVPIHNLERILQIADHTPVSLAPHIRFYSEYPEAIPSLLDVLTDAYVESLKSIELHGLYRQYYQRIEDTSFPKGRLLVGETVKRHLATGQRHIITTSWFEQSVDNPINRCLKYALWFLLQRYEKMKNRKGLRKRVRELNRLYSLFTSVSLDLSRSFLSDDLVIDPRKLPAIRTYYLQGIYLAKTIVRDRGIQFGQSGDEIAMASYVISLQDIFEIYVRTILRHHLAHSTHELRVLDGNVARPQGAKKLLFDEKSGVSKTDATPDIVISRPDTDSPNRENSIVIDTKYKVIDSEAKRDDLNQLIAYAASFGTDCVILVYPRAKEDQELVLLGTINQLRVYQYHLDLSVKALEVEEIKLARHVEQLALGGVTKVQPT